MREQLEGTPEMRLWSAVALTLIRDATDDFHEQISLTGCDKCFTRWKQRAAEHGFIAILEIVDVPISKIIKYLEKCRRHRRLELIRHPAFDAVSGVVRSNN